MLTRAEQYQLELINRARLDPEAEAARQGIDLNAGREEWNAQNPGSPIAEMVGTAKQPLAHNAMLSLASLEHGLWLLEENLFQHIGEGGSTATERAQASGYPGTAGENLHLTGTTAPTIDLEGEIEGQHNGLFLSVGHRANLLRENYHEIGIAQTEGDYTQNSDTFTVSMLVNKFGVRGATDRFLTGVAFADADGDGFYSIGEGLEGVEFAVSGEVAVTAPAGGYGLQLAPAADVAVTVTYSDTVLEAFVDLSDSNVKLDLMDTGDGLRLLSSGDLVLGAGVTEAALLGIADLALGGNDVGNLLIGNAGANLLTGGAGNDTLMGGRGDDILHGGGGWNTAAFAGARGEYDWTEVDGVVTVVHARPGSGPDEGVDTLHDIHVLRFGDGDEQVIAPDIQVADDTAEVAGPDAEVTGNVLDNDSGVDLRVTAVDGAATAVGAAISGQFGTLVLQADGSYSYIADTVDALPNGQTGIDSFAYTVRDAGGRSETGTLSISVTAAPAEVSLSGTITHRSGAAFHGAEVTFTPDDGGEAEAVTALDGSFDMMLPVGASGHLDASHDWRPEDGARIGTGSALEALRLAVGLKPSWGEATALDYIAADINGDGRVSTADALSILRIAVGLSDPNPPRWVFLDADALPDTIGQHNTTVDTGVTLSALDAPQSVDLTALLLGDVQQYGV